MILAPLLLFFAPPVETAESIMARVAENQDRAEQARTAYIFHQNILVRILRTNGKMSHEELADYTVTPTPHGLTRERTAFTGKYVDHGKVVEYHDPKEHPEHVHIDIDGEVCSSLSEDMIENKNSKDGIGNELFPLTAHHQGRYVFTLEGQEDYLGTPVYHVSFRPKKTSIDDEDPDAAAWEGDALIDRQEFQPVMISTHQAFKVPILVRTLLGTNLEHLGFKVTYKKFDDGLWFPITYGGEFRVRALFFYARKIGLSMRNDGFQRADVSSKVRFDEVK